ncbi:MAG: BNR repeat-containing protein [Phycisphaerae bacterium]|nr:BNR repeat-containing protein [Phycisphaerae bacterium]
MKNFLIVLLMFFGVLNIDVAEAKEVEIIESVDVGKVVSAFPGGFCLLTAGDNQYVAYYDDQHRMTVASRRLKDNKWQYKVLDSKIGWDSHNYITMAIDDEGYLHLSGNMHCVPLIYFRTAKPWDIATFQQVKSMTGNNEQRCTYPNFMRGADDKLIFHYRDGGSGNGNEIYNVYDLKTQKWKRLTDKPFTDGQGKMNAYMWGPNKGPDGYFHLCWVWRDSPDCQTNHDPSYARSRDLLHWENIAGVPLSLPITIDQKSSIIDAVPAKGGILNGSLKIGFDSNDKVVASYHKFDAKGNTQAYAARFTDDKWQIKQISKWDYRWEFKGNGSIGREINLGAVTRQDKGELALPYSHIKHGSGLFIIDQKNLELVRIEKQQRRYPLQLSKAGSDFPGMQVRWANDLGKCDEKDCRYVLRWESLAPNRDRKPDGKLPQPSKLCVLKLN